MEYRAILASFRTIRFAEFVGPLAGSFFLFPGLLLRVLGLGYRAQDSGLVKPVLPEFGSCPRSASLSGDSSCADHNVAWRTRNNLGLDHVPGGVSGDPARHDNIVFDLTDDVGGNPESSGGFGHPHSILVNADNESAIAGSLPVMP